MSGLKIIAELGNTHEGSLGLAKNMISAAARCGANIVKFQTHMFSFESVENAPNPPYFKGESRKNYFERTSFSKNEYIELISHCERENVKFLSSPFSVEALKFLQEIGVEYIKIPSGEVTNFPLLEAAGKSGLTVMISSGMSSYHELDTAVSCLKSNGCENLVVMQCTSMYPCPPEYVGLNNLPAFREKYAATIGFSDHTLSTSIPATAVFMGADIVEKHFTLSKLMYGSDAFNSLEPHQFSEMVQNINDAYVMRKKPVDKDELIPKLRTMKDTFEKSIVFARSLKDGCVITEDDLAAKKPGTGISTDRVQEFLGRVLSRSVDVDELLSESHFV
jgi:sialic acid synthase SpsE